MVNQSVPLVLGTILGTEKGGVEMRAQAKQTGNVFIRTLLVFLLILCGGVKLQAEESSKVYVVRPFWTRFQDLSLHFDRGLGRG